MESSDDVGRSEEEVGDGVTNKYLPESSRDRFNIETFGKITQKLLTSGSCTSKEEYMPNRKDAFVQNGCYHIFNRGANRENIFVTDENYSFFLRLLHSHLRKTNIEVICYCLMPNHFHLLLLQTSDITISTLMHGFLSAYTQAFNKQQERTGTLFEGRYKHLAVKKPETLLRLMMYIHLNPVKAKLALRPEEWEFSDYRSWGETEKLPESSGDKFNLETFGKIQRWREEFMLPSSEEYKQYCLDYLNELEDDKLLQKVMLE